LPTRKDRLAKTPESNGKVGDFVYCWGTHGGEDFGYIRHVKGDYYIIELMNIKPNWASVPMENTKMAGRA